MKNFIVITSILYPTESVYAFSKLKNYQLIVVGDEKTPKNWYCDNVIFLSTAKQESIDFNIATLIPYNHYCRKMVGYLEAIRRGAEIIVDTDDDNIPYNDWAFPTLFGEFESIRENMGFVNIYKLFTNKRIWARGLPLTLINYSEDLTSSLIKSKCTIGIWQGLADEDPDVDAIYRLTDNTPCYFNKREPIVCKKGTFSPFNTQNTLIRKELFSLLYLPTTVTFRYTDILRGLIAQPIMWLYGYELGFINATVVQKRNPHNYFSDFISEIPMYTTIEKVVGVVNKSISCDKSIEMNLMSCYKALCNESIVKEPELETLEAWLYDIKRISNSF
ncbi:MAG: DUF288 domain-containing protein [Alphaproteobacteria bacterium]|nr:DUF288 domain-containing protein [Alphaproteobacteria bacterium]